MSRAFEQVLTWVPKGSSVLDLGCGSGQLLAALSEQKNCHGYGLEIDPDCIVEAVGRGVNVIEQNLDDGLDNIADKAFDVVVMTQALQATRRPDLTLKEMLRVGRQAIVTFPNFAHISHRYQLGLKGHMPVSKSLPHQWFDTPNIHLSTFKDFDALCQQLNVEILERQVMADTALGLAIAKLRPNLFGTLALYRVQGA